ncbi:MAG: HEAT repeat domain-containing protein [Planctomycetes bacterium]|nr:HEAT repeat domain-containing protein [Planctomycetota bacterium]
MIKLAFAVAAILPFPAQDPPTDERIAHLIEQLAADYEEERLAARKELEGIGEAAEPHLIAGLEGNHYRIRKSCLELLTVLRSPKAVDPAVGLLRSDKENKGVRQAAFEYLRTAGKAAEDVMIDALDSVEVQWRRGPSRTSSRSRARNARRRSPRCTIRKPTRRSRTRPSSAFRTSESPRNRSS